MPRHQQVDLLAVVQRGRRDDAAREAELEARRVGARVGLAADVLEGERRGPEHLIPVQALQHLVDLGRAHAAGEGAADQAAHAGAGRDVDRNVVLFEPANDADVRDAAGAAAAERDADGPARFLRGGRSGEGGDAHRERQELAWSVEITAGVRQNRGQPRPPVRDSNALFSSHLQPSDRGRPSVAADADGAP